MNEATKTMIIKLLEEAYDAGYEHAENHLAAEQGLPYSHDDEEEWRVPLQAKLLELISLETLEFQTALREIAARFSHDGGHRAENAGMNSESTPLQWVQFFEELYEDQHQG